MLFLNNNTEMNDENEEYLLNKNNEVAKFSLLFRVKHVESGPPLSTILGNYGVNTVNFCKELNELTEDLPDYLFLEVVVNIFSDKTYKINIKEPTIAALLKAVTFYIDIMDKKLGGNVTNKIKVVRIRDVYLVSIFKFGYYDDNTIKTICGILHSLKLHVVIED